MTCLRHNSAMILLAALAITVLHPAAAAMNNDDPEAITKDYDECLCWNQTTARMCAANNDTINDACNNFTRAAMWYWVPVVAAAAIAMLLFPAFFACGRACNCCGGRQPSFGCCCPEAALGRRTYSKPTVVSAKVIAVILLVTMLGMVAWSITGHLRLASSISTLQGNFTSTASLVSTLRNQLGVAALNLDAVIDVPITPIPANAEQFLFDAANTTKKIANAVQGAGYLSLVALLLSVIVLVLGGCGVIGLPLTIAAMCFAFLMGIYLALLIAIGIPAQLTSFACDDGPRQNSTTRFIYQSLNVEGIASEVTNATKLVHSNVLNYFCSNLSLASLCASGNYGCDASFCSNVTQDATRLDYVLFLVPQGLRSINGCADAGPAVCPDAAAATAIMQAFGSYRLSFGAFSLTGNGDLARLISASPIDEMIHAICEGDRSIRARLRSPAGFHVVMSFVMLFGLIVGLYGAKRFRGGPRGAKVEELAAEPPMPYPTAAGYRDESLVDVVPGVAVYGIPMEQVDRQPTHAMEVAIEVGHDPHAVPTKNVAPY